MREIATAIVVCLLAYGCMETRIEGDAGLPDGVDAVIPDGDADGIDHDPWDDPGCGPHENLGYRPGCNRTAPECLPWNSCHPDPYYEFCGCDGTEFLSRCSKADRPYAYPGPCIEGIGDDTPPCGTDVPQATPASPSPRTSSRYPAGASASTTLSSISHPTVQTAAGPSTACRSSTTR